MKGRDGREDSWRPPAKKKAARRRGETCERHTTSRLGRGEPKRDRGIVGACFYPHSNPSVKRFLKVMSVLQCSAGATRGHVRTVHAENAG